jgi:endonuclease YncB( thermonuclease family)
MTRPRQVGRSIREAMRAFTVFLLAIGVFGAVGPSEVDGAVRSSRGALLATATMIRPVDGTTLMVRIGQKTRLVRLIGVQAPLCACGDQAAPLELHTELPRGYKLVLRGDPALPRSDGRGRLLAYANEANALGRSEPNRDVGLLLVEAGAARVDRTHHFNRLDKRTASGVPSYSQAEAAARANRLGLWFCASEPPTADLLLTAAAPTQVAFNTTFTAVAAVTNNGPGPARQVTFTSKGDFAPAGADWSPTIGDGDGSPYPGPYDLGGCTTTASNLFGGYGEPIPPNGTVRCVDPYLPAGATWQIQINVPAPGYPTGLGANLTVSTCTNDPDPANNTTTFSTGVRAPGS